MTEKLTKKQLKTLKNSLGMQGLTLEDHENAQKSQESCEIVQIDCFELKSQNADAEGWVVGYGVEYNGVGISAAAPETSSDDEPLPENLDVAEESSGFSSDPPSDVDVDDNDIHVSSSYRRSSDDVSDQGQLLYGIDDEFYVDKSMVPVKNTVLKGLDGEEKHFETGDFVTTKRFALPKSAQESDEDHAHNEYQQIGQEPCDDEEENSEEEEEKLKDPNTSSGLWLDYELYVPDLKLKLKAEESEEEKARGDKIQLDKEKLAQISSIAAGFSLPTPPGWENVTDEKLLDFIKRKI